MVYFLFITPLSEKLLLLKKKSKWIFFILREICISIDTTFFEHFLLQDFMNSVIFFPSKPGCVSKCHDFL